MSPSYPKTAFNLGNSIINHYLAQTRPRLNQRGMGITTDHRAENNKVMCR